MASNINQQRQAHAQCSSIAVHRRNIYTMMPVRVRCELRE
jgi:hypothetical protein